MKKDFKDKLLSSFENLPRKRQKIINFLLEHWEEVPFLNIQEIAKILDVDPSTITRLFQSLGFDGFHEFKKRISEERRVSLKPYEKFDLLSESLKGKKFLIRIARQDIKNIRRLLETVREDKFNKLITAIERADRIFAFGMGISAIFSKIAVFYLRGSGKEAYLLGENAESVEEEVAYLKKKDLLLLFSFPRYSTYTLKIASLAKEMDCTRVAFSNSEDAPISLFSDLVIPIPTENILFTNSVSALSVLMNAVATIIALKDKENLKQKLEFQNSLKKFYL